MEGAEKKRGQRGRQGTHQWHLLEDGGACERGGDVGVPKGLDLS